MKSLKSLNVSNNQLGSEGVLHISKGEWKILTDLQIRKRLAIKVESKKVHLECSTCFMETGQRWPSWISDNRCVMSMKPNSSKMTRWSIWSSPNFNQPRIFISIDSHVWIPYPEIKLVQKFIKGWMKNLMMWRFTCDLSSLFLYRSLSYIKSITLSLAESNQRES